MKQSKIENVQPEQEPINEQTADNQQVCPSIANANVIGCTVPVPEDDWEYDDCQPWEDCPKCGRTYDHIDFDYQSCSKCGWDAEKEKFDSEIKREPTDEDFMNGDADILSGCWW